MADIWEQVAPQQRLAELLKLLKEQKDKEQKHDLREDAREKKFEDMDMQLAELIEILTKRLLELDRRVAELEKKSNP
jgi:recombinational DNA repair protein (RecF pathway)